MRLVRVMDADGEVGAVESASGAEAIVDSDACDSSTCADVDEDADVDRISSANGSLRRY